MNDLTYGITEYDVKTGFGRKKTVFAIMIASPVALAGHIIGYAQNRTLAANLLGFLRQEIHL